MRKLLTLLLFASLPALAAEELHLYNWNDYIAPDSIANFEREFDFRRIREERQPAFRRHTRSAPRILRQVITTKRDVLGRRRRLRDVGRGEDLVRAPLPAVQIEVAEARVVATRCEDVRVGGRVTSLVMLP